MRNGYSTWIHIYFLSFKRILNQDLYSCGVCFFMCEDTGLFNQSDTQLSKVFVQTCWEPFGHIVKKGVTFLFIFVSVVVLSVIYVGGSIFASYEKYLVFQCFSFISRMINCVTKSPEVYIGMFLIYIILIVAHRSGIVFHSKSWY